MLNIPGNLSNYPTYVRAADGADYRNATTEAATASDLADRTAFLKDQQAGLVAVINITNANVSNATTRINQLDSRTIYFPMTLGFAMSSAWTNATGAFAGNATRPYWVQTNPNTDNPLLFDISAHLPQKCRITKFGMYVKANSQTILPSLRPVISVARLAQYRDPRNVADNSLVILDSVSDPSINITNYKLLHEVTKTPVTPIPIDSASYDFEQQSYFLQVMGQNGSLTYLSTGYLDLISLYVTITQF